MRRERRRGAEYSNDSFRNLMLISGGILIVAIIAFCVTFVVYNNKINKQSRVSVLNSEKIADLVPSISTNEETTSASSTVGKTVNEMENEITNMKNIVDERNSTIVTNTNVSVGALDEPKETTTNLEETKQPEEKKKELAFQKPVDGRIIKDYAKDNLIYSETLKEWVTHMGIDFAAEKTSIVKASEEGTIKAIKNDPRYGMTIVIEHAEGFKTIYSNLLTTEFVSEGEKVNKGQTIGTVGNSAVFEVADESHLHFEMMKDNINIDPNLYLK